MGKPKISSRAAYQRHANETIIGRSKNLLRSAKTRSQKKGIPFDLDLEWVAKRLEAGCAATGDSFVMTSVGQPRGYRHPRAPSIDRIDREGGYTKRNCRLTTWIFNHARNIYGDSDMYRFAALLLAKRHA